MGHHQHVEKNAIRYDVTLVYVPICHAMRFTECVDCAIVVIRVRGARHARPSIDVNGVSALLAEGDISARAGTPFRSVTAL